MCIGTQSLPYQGTSGPERQLPGKRPQINEPKTSFGYERQSETKYRKQNKTKQIGNNPQTFISWELTHTHRPKWLQIRSWPTVYTSPGTHGLEYSRFILPGYVNEFSVNNHFRHPISGSFLLRHDSRSPHSLRLPRPLVRNILYIHIKFAQQDEFSIVT